jgi:hypothetical protein
MTPRIERRLFLRVTAATACAAALPGTAWAAEVDATVLGAVGDGETDDTAAVQDAFDAVVGDDGLVDLPEGVFLVTEPLWVDLPGGALTIRGAGADSTRLRIEGASDDDPAVIADGGTSGVRNVAFVGIGIESSQVEPATVIGEVGVALDDLFLWAASPALPRVLGDGENAARRSTSTPGCSRRSRAGAERRSSRAN